MSNKEFDQLIRGALGSADEMQVPDWLVENTVLKIQKRALLKELIFELTVKIMLALGSIAILSGVMMWFSGLEVIKRLLDLLTANQTIVSMVLLAAFTIAIIDQVVLRYYQTWHQKSILADTI